MISFGSSVEPNVKKRVLVGITFPSFFIVTRFTPTTPWSFSSSRISTSDMSERSRHLITPREEFRVLWIETLTVLSINLFVWSRFWAWALLPHSIKKEPFLSLLMFFRVPAMAWKPFWIAKGDNFCRGRSSLTGSTIKNLGQFVSLFISISFSESVSESSSRALFLDWCFVAIVSCVMFCYVLSPPITESNKRGCTKAAFQQVRTRAQNAIYSGDKNKVYFYPLTDPQPLPSNWN